MPPTLRALRFLVLFALLLTLPGLAQADPKLLGAAVLEFPQYKPISDAEAREAMVRAARMAWDLFGISVRIDVSSRESAPAAFDRHVPPSKRLDRSGEPSQSDLSKMRERLAGLLSSVGVEDVARTGGPGTPGERAARIVEGYVLRRRSLLDSWSVSTKPPHERSLVYLGTWDRLMQSKQPHDILITNGPVLYTPQDGGALHALLRGGAIGGVTIWKDGFRAFGGTIMVTTYTLDAEDPVIRELRGRPPLDSEERIDTIASLAAHELGHLVHRLPDNYDHSNCLMRPPLDVKYLEWGRGVSAPGCARCREIAARHVAQREAELADRRGDAVAALKHWRQAISGSPDAALSNNFAYFCAERSLNLDEAQQHARRAVSMQPKNASFLDTFGWVHYRRAEFAEAERVLTQALEAAESKGDRSVILYHLACARLALGATAEARSLLERSLKEDLAGADEASARRMLGRLSQPSAATSTSSSASSPR